MEDKIQNTDRPEMVKIPTNTDREKVKIPTNTDQYRPKNVKIPTNTDQYRQIPPVGISRRPPPGSQIVQVVLKCILDAYVDVF